MSESVVNKELQSLIADMIYKEYPLVHGRPDDILEKIYRYSRNSDEDYTATNRFFYRRDEVSGVFSMKIADKKEDQKGQQALEEMIRDLIKLLDALGIPYTKKESVTKAWGNDIRRTMDCNTNITYTVPRENKVQIWNTISEGKLLAMKQSAKGWAEKMENSEFAHFLGEWVCSVYEDAFKNNPDADNQSLELDVSFQSLTFMRLPGRTILSGKVDQIKYKEHGYKDLSTNEQLVGLRWVIFSYIAERLSGLGSEYNIFTEPYYDGDADKFHYFKIEPHFTTKKELKDW